MIENRVSNRSVFLSECDDMESVYWLDFKKKKFIHNIDTLYYSIKFKNDFTNNTKDSAVKSFRKYFEYYLHSIEKDGNKFSSFVELHFPGIDEPLNLRPFSFAGYYTIDLECPEYFDIFFAPRVPHGSDGGPSVTCECIVQLRSYLLWMYGAKEAYEYSFKYVKKICDYFHLEIDFCIENRVDFCWHSNYLSNPEKFFRPDKFYKMRVDRFKDALFHTIKDGMDGYEIDYIAMGKRSQKIFIRIYLKSKEVIEKGYKPWFFKVWLFNGLINRYDLYVYEYAFKLHSWKAIDLGRLQFYSEFGRDPELKEKCDQILTKKLEMSPDMIRQFADELTPKINLVMNVEFQTMRKHSKNYCLLPFFDNTDKLSSKRIYDYLDNWGLITDYLTTSVFRLVDPKTATRKTRCEPCKFWKALKAAPIDQCSVPADDRKLVREYTRKLNSEIVKKRLVNASVTFGLYTKGVNHDNPLQDCIDALCVLNDNDIHDARNFKKRKISQFNADELADPINNYDPLSSNIRIIDTDTGQVVEHYSIELLDLQDD